MKALVVRATIALLACARVAHAQTRVLDAFESLAAWSAHPSEGVTVAIRSAPGVRGRAMRIDFDFHGGSGYALVRRKLDLPLPANYVFALQLRGNGPSNNLEFKLVDSTGDNVWWSNQRDFELPRAWTKLTRRKRHIEFAWGPAGGGEIRRAAALEIAITAGRGGKGSVWIDELTIAALDSAEQTRARQPRIVGSSASPGYGAERALDGSVDTEWRSGSGAAALLTLDFGESRELGGMVVEWTPAMHATRYAIELSDDRTRWSRAYTVAGGNGGRDYIYMPETESRYLRLRLLEGEGGGYAIREVTIQPPEWSATRNAFVRAVSRDAPRGSYPRYFDDQMVYWTVVGASGGVRQALVSEDGAVEPFAYEWSLEPFLRTGDTLLTWADVTRRQTLARGSLPIPTVDWSHGDLSLAVTVTSGGIVRYRATNGGAGSRAVTLYVAIRPFQVNTPWQFLNGTGGVGRIRSIRYDSDRLAGSRIAIVGRDSTRRIRLLTPPSGFGAVSFDNGAITDFLREGRLPPRTTVADSVGLASGVIAYALTIPPGDSTDVFLDVGITPRDRGVRGDSAVRHAVEEDVRMWDDALSRLGAGAISLPPNAHRVSETLRTSLAYMLVERNGPALQPGTRAYARSWIRDGALMSEGLGRLGHHEAVRQFIRWYTPYQRPDGRVPCCVDVRGADPVPEHDSHGELIYLIAEDWRLTGNDSLARALWPNVLRAVAYLDSLRRTHKTAEYQSDSGRLYYGLLPPSISHEGYSAKPMHSYWDDFFALKGLVDAADLAGALGRADEQRRIAAIRDDFRGDLLASIRTSMARHRVDYIPGAADLGDFDATSTTIAIAPAGELANLPDSALTRTFEKYYDNFRARRDGRMEWQAYTPYELRVVGTFVRLGWKTRAHELLDFFFAGQRPAAWRQWAEVVWKDSLAPKFIGDMPHAWVASDYVRSVLDFFAYERKADSALVIGAGIPDSWVREDSGVSVTDLRTHYGALSFKMRGRGDSVIVDFSNRAPARVELRGAPRPLTVPAGGLVVRSPLERPLRAAFADGQPMIVSPTEVVLRRMPRQLVLLY